MDEYVRILEERTKEYETIAERSLYNIDEINSALLVVARFIQEKELILFGGNAIDLALREHGDFIYPDHQLPDYDFYSTDNVNDAYELANIFKDKGFTNINVIRGIHPQTMKIRINFQWVADIGFITKENKNKIKTLRCGGFIIRHPHDQYIDIHSSLSYPFGGAPKEQIKHRWKKDIERFNKMYKYYPINLPETELSINKYEFTLEHNIKDCCFTGFIAYSFYLRELRKLTKIDEFPILKFNKTGEKTFQMELPNDITYIELITDKPSNGKEHEPLFDAIPSYKYSNNVRYYTSDFYQVSVTNFQNIKVCTFQHMLKFFLAHMLYEKNPVYQYFYVKSLKMLELSQKYIKKRDFNKSVFSISLETYGEKNMPTAYLLRLANYSEKNGVEPPYVDKELLKKLSTNLPQNYYMKKEPPIYDYNNVLFKTSGVPVFS